MIFSINNICTFEVLIGEIDINKKINVVTTSLFMMKYGGYKKFEKYIMGLELFFNIFFNHYPDFKFILFIDNSIIENKEIYNRLINLNKNNKLILIKYRCYSFMNNGYHMELFGSLIRFLPFFIYEQNNTNDVICIDADINESDLNTILLNYKYFTKLKTYYQYDTNMFYEILSPWALKKGYSIIASRHMCRYKFPLNLFTDYLSCIKNKNCKDMKIYNEILYTDTYKRFPFKNYKYFPYGVDEVFLDYVLLPYIKNRLIKYSISIRYKIIKPMDYFIRNKISDDTVKYIEKKFKYILNINENLNYKQLIEIFNNIFDNVEQKNISNEMINIIHRYYDFILEMWKDKNYNIFRKKTLKKILICRNYIEKYNINVYKDDKTIKRYIVKSHTIKI